jgi:hypothetical protein
MTAYLETFEDMLTSFGDAVREPDPADSKWLLDTRKRMINESQLAIVEETRCVEARWDTSKGVWAASGNEIVTLSNEMFPDGLISVTWYGTASAAYTVLQEDLVTDSDGIENTDTGTPSEFFRIQNNLYLRPLQDAAGTVIIIGHRLPDELVELTDQSLIPAAYRNIVPIHAAIRALRQDEQFRKARSLFEEEYLPLYRRLKRMGKTKHQRTRSATFVLPRNL